MLTNLAENILSIVESLENPGHFVAGGKLDSSPNPGLSVTNVGVIGLPLSEQQAKSIIEQCEPAPFGRKEATLFDKTVRDTWQLHPGQFQILNRKWENMMKEVCADRKHYIAYERVIMLNTLLNIKLVSMVRMRLGFSEDVRYEPYKLLLYEELRENPWNVRISHVTSPSQFEGGQLITRHGGQEQVFDLAADSLFGTQYVGFYCDVEHEVKRVTKGYRLALTYNLIYTGRGNPPRLIDNSPKVTALADQLRWWTENLDNIDESKLAYILDHEYTAAGLSFNGLKNKDAVIAALLQQAVRTSGSHFHVFLAQLERHESGVCGYDHGYETMDEVTDSSMELKSLLGADGRRYQWDGISFEVGIDESEVMQDISDYEWDDEKVEEATGNAGATTERWYSKAVLVIWPKEEHHRILTSAGVAGALQVLKEDVGKMLGSGDGSYGAETREDCVALADSIIETVANAGWRGYGYTPPSFAMHDLLAVVCMMGDDGLFRKVVKGLPLKRHMSGTNLGQLAQILVVATQCFGWERIQLWTASLLQARPSDVAFWSIFVANLWSAWKQLPNTEPIKAWCIAILHKLIPAIKKVMTSTITKYDGYALSRPRNAPPISDDLRIVFLTSTTFPEEATELLPAFLTTLLESTTDQNFRTTTKQFEPFLRAYLNEKAIPPSTSPFNNFYENTAKRSCRCVDCDHLVRFMNNPHERVGKFKLAEKKRNHLERVLKGLGCDVETGIEYRGSPYTLIVTKTDRRLRERIEMWKEDKVHLGFVAGVVGRDAFVEAVGEQAFSDIVGEGVGRVMVNEAQGTKRSADRIPLRKNNGGGSSEKVRPVVQGLTINLDSDEEEQLAPLVGAAPTGGVFVPGPISLDSDEEEALQPVGDSKRQKIDA
ncbi:hypothetical protein HK097_001773 [Rhizophlyctis rosea]|uniref:Prolyl 4-hydroxylase alpha subunit Fe(2+) 2OG dioxygenase domain-containing protein n=1 Tax=Rhizophlyctis rosea TaxID=64517 RepID=A0AAD5S6C6_9FUNG|nr:hypothetical protein HK097_001773 [Rhizophlyctis rosea]